MRKVYIIAGASKGVGYELALSFDTADNYIINVARSKQKLDALGAKFKNTTPMSICCDLVSEADVMEAFKDVKLNQFDEINLINCAATWTGGELIEETSASRMREAFNLNFMTAFNAIQIVLERRSSEQLTKIVNLGATASLRGGASTASFAVGKSSLRILTQSLAREMAHKNLHAAHIVIDGLIFNPRTKKLNPGVAETKYIRMDSLVKSIQYLLEQPRDCWTLELDIRPYCEKF